MRAMKDSGIAWIGEIPEEWKICKIKQLADQNKENSFVDGDWIESPYIVDSGIRYLTTGNIGDGVFKEQGNGFISLRTFEKLSCKYAFPGDLIFSRLNAPYGRSCILPSDFAEYVVAVDNVILRTQEDKRYICYVSQCDGYKKAVDDEAKGTTMKRISRTNLGNIAIPLPPIQQQHRIADYLDRKCSQIDAIIAWQQEVIEKLKAYKLSVITEAVTKGLNPHAPMKDSGVEWIGEIPEQWEIRRIGSFAKVTSSKRIFEESYVDEGVPFYRSKEITDLSKGLNVQTEIFIPEGIFTQVSKVSPAPKSGDILLTSIGTIGNTWISDGRKFYYKDGNITQIEANDSFDSAYLEYCFSSNVVLEQYTRLAMGSTLLALTIVKIKKILVAFPPLNEQRKIVRFLRIKCGSIENIVKHKQSLINKLAAYKKSLIYEVVTGKKEVK